MKLWQKVEQRIAAIKQSHLEGEALGFYRSKVQPFMFTWGAPMNLLMGLIIVLMMIFKG